MATADMATDLALALDPVCLAEAAGMYPDRWQRDVLRGRASRLLLNCARQSGKSTTVAVLTLHTALYEPGSLSLVLSPGERQSLEFLRKVTGLYRTLGRPVPSDVENKLELELSNGSRIIALPGVAGTIRGYSGVRLLVVDEASRVDDALMAAVRPMLAVSGGRLLALSTPWGKRGWWWKAYEQGGAPWERVKITALECPRISPEFLAEERRELGDLFYRSEYLCQFVETVDQVFSDDLIQSCISADVQPLFPSVPIREDVWVIS